MPAPAAISSSAPVAGTATEAPVWARVGPEGVALEEGVGCDAEMDVGSVGIVVGALVAIVVGVVEGEEDVLVGGFVVGFVVGGMHVGTTLVASSLPGVGHGGHVGTVTMSLPVL